MKPVATMQSIAVAIVMMLSVSLPAQTPAADTQKTPEAAAKVAANPIVKPDLDLAFKKEFTLLNVQKQELLQRLELLKKEQKERLSQSQTSLESLSRKLSALESQREKAFQGQKQLEDKSTYLEEMQGLLEATLLQAEATSKKYAMIAPEDLVTSDPSNQPTIEPTTAAPTNTAQTNTDSAPGSILPLKLAFARGLTILQAGTSSSMALRSYFDSQGQQQTGEVLHYGAVAAITSAGEHLIPSGISNFKVLEKQGTNKARAAMLQGQESGIAELFLFDNFEKDQTPQAEKTLQDTMRAGGSIGWVIVILGFLAILVTLIRYVLLKKASRKAPELMAALEPLITNHKPLEVIRACEQRPSAISRVVTATVANIDQPMDKLEAVVSERILRESTTIDRFGGILMVVASVAPLLGLLGTVTGMIATFDVIAEFGTSDPKLLSGGISEALVTTMLGLIVAIPAIFVGNILTSWGERLKGEIQQAALHVANKMRQPIV